MDANAAAITEFSTVNVAIELAKHGTDLAAARRLHDESLATVAAEFPAAIAAINTMYHT